MRHVATGVLALALLAAGGCGGEPSTPENEAAEAAGEDATVEAADQGAAPESAESSVEASATVPGEAQSAAPGAPVFAVIYPGGEVAEDNEGSSAAPGADGILTFRAQATPQQIIDFYRARAEAEGLASVMAMNQGATRAYGAHSTATGASLLVAATEDDDGVSVQLEWNSGG